MANTVSLCLCVCVCFCPGWQHQHNHKREPDPPGDATRTGMDQGLLQSGLQSAPGTGEMRDGRWQMGTGAPRQRFHGLGWCELVGAGGLALVGRRRAEE